MNACNLPPRSNDRSRFCHSKISVRMAKTPILRWECRIEITNALAKSCRHESNREREARVPTCQVRNATFTQSVAILACGTCSRELFRATMIKCALCFNLSIFARAAVPGPKHTNVR